MGDIQSVGKPGEAPNSMKLSVRVSHESKVYIESSRRNRRWPHPKLSVPSRWRTEEPTDFLCRLQGWSEGKGPSGRGLGCGR